MHNQGNVKQELWSFFPILPAGHLTLFDSVHELMTQLISAVIYGISIKCTSDVNAPMKLTIRMTYENTGCFAFLNILNTPHLTKDLETIRKIIAVEIR